MAVIHVLSVGISLINKVSDMHAEARREHRISRGSVELFNLPQANANADEKSEWIKQVLRGNSDETNSMIRDKKVLQWSWRTSAELTAIHAIGAIEETDTVFLLASDTPEGLTAALYNAYILAGGVLERILYRPEAGDDLGELRGKIVIYRIVNLDIQDDERFKKAMRELGSIGREILALMEADEYAPVTKFHLTGGYRSLLPFLLSLAEALRGIRYARQVKAYTVPETATSQAIELPLRSFPADLLGKGSLFDGFDAEGNGDCPNEQMFERSVYEVNGLRAQLTPFGHGLRELFDRSRQQL